MHQKDIQENDPFGQNGDEADEADDEADDEKSFLKARLAERALKKNNFLQRITKLTIFEKFAKCHMEIGVLLQYRYITLVFALPSKLGMQCW